MKIEGCLRNIVLAHLLVAIASVSVGMIFGLLQVLSRAKIFVISNDLYYQGLTLHGVLNAVVFTTFFIVGFLYIIAETSLKEKLNKNLIYLSFAVMLLCASNKSSERTLHLLSTPEGSSHILHRHSWIAILNTVLTFLRWRKKNPGVKTPGPMVGVIATYAVWFLATIGIAMLGNKPHLVEDLVLVVRAPLGLFLAPPSIYSLVLHYPQGCGW